MNRFRYLWFAFVISFCLGHPLALSQATNEHAVIITLKDQFNSQFLEANRGLRRSKQIKGLRSHSKATQATLLDLLRSNGAKNIRQLWINNSIAATVTDALLNEINNLSEVESVVEDRVITLNDPQPSLAGSPSWNLDLIEAPQLWLLGQKGAGTVVAIMDTGVDYQNLAISSQFRGGNNSWFDPSGEHPNTPYDSSGHGTGVAGILVGGNVHFNNVSTAIGVAPLAQWIGVKIFDDAGNAPLSNIHAAYQWLLDPDGNPDTDDAPDIVNNSWGFNSLTNNCYSEFQSDILALKSAGIAVVTAAGNTGPSASSSISPGNYADSTSVGSVGQDMSLASSSGRGPSACDGSIYPNVVAPGVNILTAAKTLSGTFKEATAYDTGTSFATPHVAGAIALLISAFPQTPISEIEAALDSTAQDLGLVGADNAYGAGLISLMSAFNYLATLYGEPANGCLRDSDNDGSSDCDDDCPLDQNKIDLGQCGCSIPDTDSDGDGVANCLDQCPNDAAKTSPGACGCSKQDVDTDGDGVLDCNDACPNDPQRTASPCSSSGGSGTNPPTTSPPTTPTAPAESSGGCQQNSNGSLPISLTLLIIVMFAVYRRKRIS